MDSDSDSHFSLPRPQMLQRTMSAVVKVQLASNFSQSLESRVKSDELKNTIPVVGFADADKLLTEASCESDDAIDFDESKSSASASSVQQLRMEDEMDLRERQWISCVDIVNEFK